MKKILSITALTLALSFSTAAIAAPETGPSYMEQAISKLPSDEADQFHAAMEQAHEQNKDLYAQMHELHQDLHNILIADTFDKDAFIAKSRDIQQLHDKAADNLDMAFADALAPLSPSDRAMLATAMGEQHAAKKAHKKAQQ